MDQPPRLVEVVPNRRIPNILGLLNIVFASGFLLCGLCWGGSSLMTPFFMKTVSAAQKKDQEAARVQKEAVLKELETEEAQAKTDEEKIEVRARRKEIESRPTASAFGFMDYERMGIMSRKIVGWTWAEILSGLLVNSLMLAAGIGLLQYKAWARSLGVWTAALKIVRLGLLYGFAILVIIPDFSSKMGTVVYEMMVQQQRSTGKPIPPTLSAEWFSRSYIITYSIMAAGTIVVGSIYPIVSVWLLSKRSVKAACVGAKPAPSGGKDEIA